MDVVAYTHRNNTGVIPFYYSNVINSYRESISGNLITLIEQSHDCVILSERKNKYSLNKSTTATGIGATVNTVDALIMIIIITICKNYFRSGTSECDWLCYF